MLNKGLLKLSFNLDLILHTHATAHIAVKYQLDKDASISVKVNNKVWNSLSLACSLAGTSTQEARSWIMAWKTLEVSSYCKRLREYQRNLASHNSYLANQLQIYVHSPTCCKWAWQISVSPNLRLNWQGLSVKLCVYMVLFHNPKPKK